MTQDKIALGRHTDVLGHPSEEVLNFAYLNSHYQTGLKNLLDRAVLERVELQAELKLEQDYQKSRQNSQLGSAVPERACD